MRCKLLENSSDVALVKYRRQMHHGIVTPEVSAQEKSVRQNSVKFSLETQKTPIMRKREPKITREQFFSFKKNCLFREEKSQVAVWYEVGTEVCGRNHNFKADN